MTDVEFEITENVGSPVWIHLVNTPNENNIGMRIVCMEYKIRTREACTYRD